MSSEEYLPLRRLTEYLDYFTDAFGCYVVIKSFVPFFSLDRRVARALYRYHLHKNPYCSLIKSDPDLFPRCNQMIAGIEKRCAENPDGFWGTCHAGVHEFILPLHYRDTAFGYISIHGFNGHPSVAAHRMRQAQGHSSLELGIMEELYRETMHPYRQEIHPAIKATLNLIAEYLEYIYARLRPALEEQTAEAIQIFAHESNLLSRILQFINENYTGKITVRSIAEASHCSASSVTHVFKKNMGMNIHAYVNRIRIEKAQYYLRNTDANVTEIGALLGFDDPNYFTKVFSDIRGVSPKTYRRNVASIGGNGHG